MVTAIAGCACNPPARPTAEPPATPRALSEEERLRERAETAWRQRDDVDALARAISAWHQLAERDPSAAGPWLRIAEAHHALGELTRLRTPVAFDTAAQAFTDGERAADEALARCDAARLPEDAPERAHAAYWRALGRHAAVAASEGDYLALLTTEDDLQAALERCVAIDANYDHAGAHRRLGAFYARPLVFAERDLARATAHFGQATERAPDYLATRVALAEHLSVAMQSRETFDVELRRVLGTSPDATPPIAADQRLAQERALSLLERAEELFE